MLEAINDFMDYLPEDLIRGDNLNAFTRVRKITVQELVLQMMTRYGKSQWGELMDFYCAREINRFKDCLNSIKLDLLVESAFDNERVFASDHIQQFCENYIEKAIFTFDRGYPSMQLIDQLIEGKQYFLFRIPTTFLSGHTKDMKIGEDKLVEVTFVRKSKVNKSKMFYRNTY